MRKTLQWIPFLFLVISTQALTGPALAADGDALRARLVELKQLMDEGLIPGPIYEAEVAKAIREFARGAEAPAAPEKPAVREPVPQGAVPAADAGEDAQTIPPIEWGQLNLFFTISDVRKGIVKEKRPTGGIEIYPAIIFDVRAKETFSLATTLFEAVFIDEEGYEITSYPVDIKEKHDHLNWKPGMRGIGRIGLVGMVLSDVGRIRIKRGFSTLY